MTGKICLMCLAIEFKARDGVEKKQCRGDMVLLVMVQCCCLVGVGKILRRGVEK